MEAFSDGVFAFAVTLLVLGTRIPRLNDPDASAGLQKLVVQQWPSYVAFALTFTGVGLAWLDPRISLAGFAFLGIVYLLPTPRVLMLAQRTRNSRRSRVRR